MRPAVSCLPSAVSMTVLPIPFCSVYADLGLQALQARVAALESEQNTKVSSILHADISDPMADADLVMPQAGIPVVDAAPVHKSSSAAAALETSSGAPLLGQPLPELSAQVPDPSFT